MSNANTFFRNYCTTRKANVCTTVKGFRKIALSFFNVSIILLADSFQPRYVSYFFITCVIDKFRIVRGYIYLKDEVGLHGRGGHYDAPIVPLTLC